jgi:hypothetical protein
METAQLKEQLHKYIEQANEQSLYLIYDILRNDTDEDWWDTLPSELKASINKSIEQLERGEGRSHEVVMRETKEKYVSK